MKSNTIKSFFILIVFMFQASNNLIAQQKSFTKNNSNDQSVVMTWNKNTPDQEMLDDITALKQNNGVIIKYSNLKRNQKGEITALKIEYKDSDGNTGSQEYNGKNAISEIKFFKINDRIGFGEPNDNASFAFNNLNFNDLQKSFGNRIQMDTLMQDNFDLNPSMKKKSKIVIRENGKKPLTIEDGKVLEGGEDYTPEEIEKIKKEHQFNFDNGGNEKLDFNFSSENLDIKSLKEQIQKMQNQLMEINPNLQNKDNPKQLKDLKSEKDTTKEELKQAKEEMLKAKKEMEEARAALEKAKSEIKMRKT
ncbi:hypothetical protein [Flavobacterium sp.]|uniref:hypothetical protein n=1 Tax=Flavobacterium sp. TaxID=239 RepID=UPI00286C0F02|nr:hypothetical protein [Flavobacterium sp.]